MLAIGAASAPAASSWHLSGGGAASLSQVAFNVKIGDSGGASGSFECLMAGRSKFVLPRFGLAHIMAVHAWPDSGSVSGSVASFSGPGQLIMDNGQKVGIEVDVWANTATQSFQLTVVGLTTVQVETMERGRFSLR